VERYLEKKMKDENRNIKPPSPGGQWGGGKGGYAMAAPDGSFITKQSGDCSQFFFKGACADPKCGLHHIRTIVGLKGKKGGGKKGKGKGRGKGKGKGKKGKKGKGKGGGKKGKKEAPSGKGKWGGPPSPATADPAIQAIISRRGTSPSGVTDAKPCHWNLTGVCSNGKHCNFWHSGVCKYWKADPKSCPCGRRCPYAHNENALTAKQLTARAKWEEKQKATAEPPAAAEAPKAKATPKGKRCQTPRGQRGQG